MRALILSSVGLSFSSASCACHLPELHPFLSPTVPGSSTHGLPAKGSPSCADLMAMEAQRRDKRSVLALLPEKCRERCLALAALTLFSAPAASPTDNVGDPAVPGTLDHADLSPGFKVE